MPTTEDQVRAALAGVKDPEIRRPITDLGMVKGVAVDPDGRVTVQVWLTVAGCLLRETITRDVTAAVAPLPGVADVRVELDVMSDTQRRQLQDTLRGGTAASAIALQTHQQVIGVVENMSWLELPDGSRIEVFGAGGGAAVAQTLSRALGTDVPVLGQIPLDTRLREAGDEGVPLVLSAPDSPAARALSAVADRLASRQRGLSGRSLGLTPVRR